MSGGMGGVARFGARGEAVAPELHDVSPLTLRVDLAPSGLDPAAGVRLLRRAVEAGITTFDTVGVPDVGLAETLLARAFPEPGAPIVVLQEGTVPPRSPGPSGDGLPVAPGVHRWGETARAAPRSSRFRRLVELRANEPAPAGVAGPVVRRCGTTDQADAALRASSPALLSGEYSLLQRDLAEGAARSAAVRPFGWVARDPFAGGRLDGSRFAPTLPGARPAPPRSVRELDAEFAPVARYRSLALAGRRTLAQAALRFLLARPWVVTVCVPPPSVERWDELFRLGESAPLSDAELRAVDELKRPDRVGAG